MKNYLCFILLFSVLLIASCGGRSDRQRQDTVELTDESVEMYSLTDEELGFFQNLSQLCGKSFQGRETYMAPGRESWAEKDFVMHVSVCENDRVLIPFHLDEDHSRTWMFLLEDGRLRFRHDHRHPDGTPEELTLYGGYADGTGTAYAQSFPADQYTIELLTDTLGRQWNIIMDEALTNFSYQLQYMGETVFRADFDLSDPL